MAGRAELPHSRVLLGTIVALAHAVHLVGIRKDLPYTPEIDEPLVVNAAVRIRALVDTDPGWFGHPASTLVYSLAAVYRLWSVVAYHEPLIGRAPRLMARFLAGGGEFYLLGRLLNVGYALAGLFSSGPSAAGSSATRPASSRPGSSCSRRSPSSMPRSCARLSVTAWWGTERAASMAVWRHPPGAAMTAT